MKKLIKTTTCTLIISLCCIGLYFAQNTITMVLVAALAILAWYFNTKC